jgi:hypothetical protein
MNRGKDEEAFLATAAMLLDAGDTKVMGSG